MATSDKVAIVNQLIDFVNYWSDGLRILRCAQDDTRLGFGVLRSSQ
jgi:hypothetical protein